MLEFLFLPCSNSSALGNVLGLRKDQEPAVTLCLLQDFQRAPDRKRELDPGSSSQTQGDEKMEFPEGMQAGSEQNNSLPSTGKGEPVVVKCYWTLEASLVYSYSKLEMAGGLNWSHSSDSEHLGCL